jgi:hypothetical protein
MAPSGADLIGQFHGKITYFHKQAQLVESVGWPFDDLSLLLLRTGQKIATYDHLQNLGDFPIARLSTLTLQALDGLKEANADRFISAINDYRRALKHANLTLPHTTALIKALNTPIKALAIKGCGAMGADVILLVIPKSERAHFVEKINQLKLAVVADENDISIGLKLR